MARTSKTLPKTAMYNYNSDTHEWEPANDLYASNIYNFLSNNPYATESTLADLRQAIIACNTNEVYLKSQYPYTADFLYPTYTSSNIEANSSGNKANAIATATLAASASTVTYITGFEITAAGATAAAVVTATVTGLERGTLYYTFGVPAGAAVMATPLVVEFPLPLPASGLNVPIVVTLPALGAGNTNATVTAHGFKRIL